MGRDFRDNSKHDDSFWKNKMKLEKIREDGKKNYERGSNERLCKIIEKNFNTAIIGALSDFEKEFGPLWGQGKKKGELSEREREMREIWEDVRKSILDRGNGKKRASIREISNNEVKWNRYKYNFEVRK